MKEESQLEEPLLSKRRYSYMLPSHQQSEIQNNNTFSFIHKQHTTSLEKKNSTNSLIFHQKILPKKGKIISFHQDLEWEKSQESSVIEEISNSQQFISVATEKDIHLKKNKTRKLSFSRKSQSEEFQVPRKNRHAEIQFRRKTFEAEKPNEKILNNKIFNLNKHIQSKLYYFNFIINLLVRSCLLGFLILLEYEQKWIYLYIFCSLFGLAVMFYVIAMIKLLFTRSDNQSVQLQKVFMEMQYADIQMQRVLRKHFTVRKIVSSMSVFVNPCTRFNRNLKISFLRQEIFKRMELVMCFIPFCIIFLINRADFKFQTYQYANQLVSGVVCIEIIRTALHYLIIYICA